MSKRYASLKEKFAKLDALEFNNAIKLVKENTNLKFNPSINVVFILKIDTTKADQQIKGDFVLPHSTGKQKRILLLVPDGEMADYENIDNVLVGGSEMIAKIKKEKYLEYDVVIASLAIANELKSLARILGPRGLMPTTKNKYLVPSIEISRVLKEVLKGKVNFKNDKQGLIHGVIGKADSTDDNLLENFMAYYQAIKSSRPPAVKGSFINSIYINAAMCPSIKLKLPKS